jgi:transcriptional regulator with XRE-family HTH domain
MAMQNSPEALFFGPLLGRMRRQRGLRQDDLAMRLGCKRTYVSQLERNLKLPSRTQLEHLIAALELGYAEANSLIEAATLSRNSLEFPADMPLPVKRQLMRLIRHKDPTSLGSWSALQRELAQSGQ